ncbi:MAG: LacI family DNA-binding transcriptional regulator [Candidatus Brevundimonas colombiensis]|uniref:LacI family DNA-binding transcriptional regulator n=1 Tax=Candidatus Brevundimonas colombiensis TaxID=3121376 RepID=A0AAJ6BLF5_9CAUL|nr:LacI family DNA-binding transcriptional regulator [Brevundimonas sp.]WEK41463.1 MAG: LacI family DNA-binding transcriptional regulator [Brevundimonas sp.]
MTETSSSQRRPTIKDVAQHAGVSFKTVSRVVNNEPGVRAELRERVNASVEALGFKPNLAARSLSGGRSFLIGLISQQTEEDFRDNYSYLLAIEAGLLDRCRELGYSLAIEVVRAEADPKDELRAALGGMARDALILLPPVSDDAEVLAALEKTGAPLVRFSPTWGLDRTAHVRMDDDAAAFALTTALIEAGHRRIGLVAGHPRHGSASERRRGHVRALLAAGLDIDEALIAQGYFTEESGFEAARLLLDVADPPTAIFASNDNMAVGVRRAARERGLTVPVDLSVVGFDGLSTVLDGWPTLTTVRQPLYEMARAAIDAAHAIILGDAPPASVLDYVQLAGATISPPNPGAVRSAKRSDEIVG